MESVTKYFEEELERVRTTFLLSLEDAMGTTERDAVAESRHLDEETKTQDRVRRELLAQSVAQEKSIAFAEIMLAQQTQRSRQ